MIPSNRTTALVTRIRSAASTVTTISALHAALTSELSAINFPTDALDTDMPEGVTKAQISAALAVLAALNAAVTPEARDALYRVL